LRYIPDSELQLPEGWEERAQGAQEELFEAEAQNRSEIISGNSTIWRDIKEALGKLSNGKCWYCETKEIRSDRVVDHFRPKSRVAECHDHPGYWWLAFDASNYRYSCTFCNSLRKSEADEPAGGKGDHFPIVDENSRAFRPEDPLENELPYLLDPRNPGDPLLLTFQDDGRAVPRCDEVTAAVQHMRAKTSVKIYHLNHPDIKEARYLVCDEMGKLVEEGDRAFLRQEGPAAAALVGKESFDSIVRRIRLMVDDNAEYSRAARVILAAHRTKPWIDSMVSDL